MLKDLRKRMIKKGFRAHEWKGAPSYGWHCKFCSYFLINPPFTKAHLKMIDGLCGRSLYFKDDPKAKEVLESQQDPVVEKKDVYGYKHSV